MKLITKNVGIFAVALVAVSLTGSFAIADEFQEMQLGEQTGTVYGHVTTTLYNADGNVIQYTQSDNRIVENGLDMLAINTFSPAGGFTGGINTALTPVISMQVGSGVAEVAATANVITAIASCNADTFTGTGAGASGSSTSVTLSGIFTTAGDGAGCAATIGEAGLFDGATGSGTDDMFAQNAFASTVILTSTDQLNVDWTFTFTDT